MLVTFLSFFFYWISQRTRIDPRYQVVLEPPNMRVQGTSSTLGIRKESGCEALKDFDLTTLRTGGTWLTSLTAAENKGSFAFLR